MPQKTTTAETCERAKSPYTPCWLKDGPVTEVQIYGVSSCVGCEMSVDKLAEERDARSTA